jgi:hypothetical protein
MASSSTIEVKEKWAADGRIDEPVPADGKSLGFADLAHSFAAVFTALQTLKLQILNA